MRETARRRGAGVAEYVKGEWKSGSIRKQGKEKDRSWREECKQQRKALFLLTAIADRKEGRGEGEEGRGGQNCQAPLFLFTFSCYTFFSCRSHSLLWKSTTQWSQDSPNPFPCLPICCLGEKGFPPLFRPSLFARLARRKEKGSEMFLFRFRRFIPSAAPHIRSSEGERKKG